MSKFKEYDIVLIKSEIGYSFDGLQGRVIDVKYDKWGEVLHYMVQPVTVNDSFCCYEEELTLVRSYE